MSLMKRRAVPPGGPTKATALSHCRVDANGISAEWVEAATATEDQPTFVFFVSRRHLNDAPDTSRSLAAGIAIATGARVLTVACGHGDGPARAGGVEEGVTAYAWLLGEGCNLNRTSFIGRMADVSLGEAILHAAVRRGLPPPGKGAQPFLAETASLPNAPCVKRRSFKSV